MADQGPGIADADLPHIFDRFYRADTARNTPGTGLGLSIVAQTITRHGGWITRRPIGPGRGRVHRPAARGHQPGGAATGLTAALTSGPSTGSGRGRREPTPALRQAQGTKTDLTPALRQAQGTKTEPTPALRQAQGTKTELTPALRPATNLVVLVGIVRVFRTMRSGAYASATSTSEQRRSFCRE